MQKKIRFLFISLFLLLPSHLPAATLTINTSIKPPFSTEQQDGFFDQLLAELFRRAGYEAVLSRLPAERALLMVNEGYSDADVPRVAGLEKKYPNLIRVPEAVINYEFTAFMRHPVETELTWQGLEQKQVGMIIGWKIYENNVPKNSRISRVSKPQQLFKLLFGNRVDIILYERYAGMEIIARNNYTDLAACRPPLAVKPMYLYLHRRHAALVAPLAELLREMKVDGTWQRIAAVTLNARR